MKTAANFLNDLVKAMTLQMRKEIGERINSFRYGAIAHKLYDEGAAILCENNRVLVLCGEGKHFYFAERGTLPENRVGTWVLNCTC